ncbi:zf-HC2 domain-containing protein [Kitasatospora acidiphila]|uniref:Zf-HC2 domain-containing protein n=1 Tax=Kitasatospora acidiphila TaxID=2567942 RepID=A0A540WCU0_9ACTN|nr:zf-HC2 domain-containing protein [Kitasatospora acidiphila]TQF06833.1 zf-HC2 domain-containing protein [Kitasatospora acidiphila]
MTCADCRAAMSAHLDGELAAGHDAGPAYSAHLARCVDCADWLAGARRLRELVSAATGPSPQQTQRLVAAVLEAASRQARVGNDGRSVGHEGS